MIHRESSGKAGMVVIRMVVDHFRTARALILYAFLVRITFARNTVHLGRHRLTPLWKDKGIKSYADGARILYSDDFGAEGLGEIATRRFAVVHVQSPNG
jgi:hypothetical protein